MTRRNWDRWFSCTFSARLNVVHHGRRKNPASQALRPFAWKWTKGTAKTKLRACRLPVRFLRIPFLRLEHRVSAAVALVVEWWFIAAELLTDKKMLQEVAKKSGDRRPTRATTTSRPMSSRDEHTPGSRFPIMRPHQSVARRCLRSPAISARWPGRTATPRRAGIPPQVIAVSAPPPDHARPRGSPGCTAQLPGAA